MEVNQVQQIRHGQEYGTKESPFQKQTSESMSFGEMLNFSKHAVKRLEERDIAIDHRFLGDLEQAVDGARKKGARDVAVISSQGVFIVNVPNNIVVTTISQNEMKEKIFTNIDSAVIL